MFGTNTSWRPDVFGAEEERGVPYVSDESVERMHKGFFRSPLRLT
jgi:hypothetical protein